MLGFLSFLDYKSHVFFQDILVSGTSENSFLVIKLENV